MEAKIVRARPRSAVCALLGLAAATVMSTAGCGSKAPAVTGLTVTITMVGVAADQLELSVSTPAGVALAPTRRPASAGAILTSPQSVSIFLPDDLAGQVATCTVTPYVAGQIAGDVGSGTTTLVLHQLAPLAIELDAQTHADGSADGAGGADGQADADADADDADGGDASGAGGAKALGQLCGADGECDSTLCRDGVCCASACGTLCQACNVPGKQGTCSPVPVGAAPAPTAAQQCAAQPASSCAFNGMCDGNGGCQKYPAGVACKVASCMGASYLPASACDGQGICVAAKAVDCTPYNCSVGAPACLATCQTGGTDCASPAVCTNGSCGARPKKALGAGCVADADCSSVHCADGVCCATTCTGSCMACNVTGMEGACSPVGVGKADPHAVCKDAGATTCGRNGLCDGAGACALYPTTTTCAAGSCKNATLHPAHHCDGKGACAVPTDVDCTPFRCNATTTACYTTCAIGALQCAARHACANAVCQ